MISPPGIGAEAGSSCNADDGTPGGRSSRACHRLRVTDSEQDVRHRPNSPPRSGRPNGCESSEHALSPSIGRVPRNGCELRCGQEDLEGSICVFTSGARKAAAGATALLLAAALSACSFNPWAKPTFTDIAGVWVNGETRLTLKDDSTFTLVNAPIYTDPSRDQEWRSGTSETYDWIGEWTLETFGVSLNSADHHNSTLSFSRHSGEWVLFFGIDPGSGDPRCSELVREGSDRVPERPKECVIY